MKTSPHRTKLLAFAIAALAVLQASHARAEDDGGVTTEAQDDPAIAEARREFLMGAELVRGQRWGDALAAFERAAKKKPHAITTFNIAQCERATGQYTLARAAFQRALLEDEHSGGGQLADSVRAEAHGLLAEIDRVLARVHVTLAPMDAQIAVDGRPLERAADAGPSAVFIAGTHAPGPPESPGVSAFDVLVNPGAHVLTVSRTGYADVVVNRSFSPGSDGSMSLELDRLPAVFHITSNLADAVVRVDDVDVGNAPVEVTRKAGRYRVSVKRKGYVSFETDVTATPGQQMQLPATLREEKKALTQQWWFWTIASAVVVGAATTTYFVTRPEPTRTPPDGGGLGWSLKTP